ncbi:MAG: threonine--tRNA ligase [Candidatus Cloacimonetes bacterium]|nr:threonine--tRNA ligase [Candidatus Cloacimonadota bacterium]
MQINITFPDKSVKAFNAGISAFGVAKSISNKFAERVVAAEINGKMYDPDIKLTEDAQLFFHTFDTEKGKEVFWHSTSHLMAQAVKELFPEVKVAIGPAIENGFYYDFDREESFTEDELLQIEEKIYAIAKSNYVYERQELSRKEAIDLFEKKGEIYKIELLNEIPEDETISIYTLHPHSDEDSESDYIHGTFTDLCRGPHLRNSTKVKAVKLLKTSGAYWRGDEKNKMLKRIYGISFPSAKELENYLEKLEEAKKRDHRKLGKDLDLFSVSDEIGAGLILWHPKGALMRHIIESYWKEKHLKNGYQLVYTPHIGKVDLWNTSGHTGFYQESMYSPILVDEQEYFLKPMNCPYHINIYKSTKRSYRELPIKYAEMGTVYRYERSGTLHGLMRVRGFTQDDAHIICTPEQMMEEVEKIIEFSIMMLRDFGFINFQIFLSTRPEKYVGEVEDWDKATLSLKSALEKLNLIYEIDEGGGAFYGPKIDIKIKDALDRAWQCSTIQFDFNLTSRFNMEYVGSDNQPHRPLMIHRALLGSLERFFGTLIEFYGGNFPVWLAPVQAILLTVSDNSIDYANEVYNLFLEKNIRVNIDIRSEKIGYKIREAEMSKIPFILVVGEKEIKTKSLSVRRHKQGDLGSCDIEEVISMIKPNNVT